MRVHSETRKLGSKSFVSKTTQFRTGQVITIFVVNREHQEYQKISHNVAKRCIRKNTKYIVACGETEIDYLFPILSLV